MKFKLDPEEIAGGEAHSALAELDETERQRQTIRFAKSLVLKLGS